MATNPRHGERETSDLGQETRKAGEQAAQTARALGDAAERTTQTGLKLFSGMPMPHVKHGKGEVRRPAALRSVAAGVTYHGFVDPSGGSEDAMIAKGTRDT
jgi:hypothetical protein